MGGGGCSFYMFFLMFSMLIMCLAIILAFNSDKFPGLPILEYSRSSFLITEPILIIIPKKPAEPRIY